MRPDGNGAPPRASRPYPPRTGQGERRPYTPRSSPPAPPTPPPAAQQHPGDGPSGQQFAHNRSRPIYPDAARSTRGGFGKPYGQQRAVAPRPGAPTRRGTAGIFMRRDRNVRPPQHEMELDSPALPQDPREAALRILYEVDVRGAFSDRLLEGAHARGADERDQALLHEMVKGTLRWRGRIDWILDQIVHIGIAGVQPWVKNVLRLGAYQILFLDRVPTHAAVDESVKLAHKVSHPGAAGLVNSVLRRLAEEKDSLAIPAGDDAASLAVAGSHPEWLVARWLQRFGVEATRDLLLANNQPARLGLRVNALRGTRDQLIARLKQEGVTAEAARLSPDLVWAEGRVSPTALIAFREGWCTAQDESEALVARLVAPEQHERLLDLCAAPGGKCTHLAELMKDEGEVWAMDRAPERARSLEQTVQRLGTHAVHVVEGDGRTYSFPMPFDRVLVDAPCSGLGVLARRADARWRKGADILREMPALQLELLDAGGRRLRPGGVLVYSVCSFEPEETTDVVERFLKEHPSFVLESAAGVLPPDVVDEHGFMRVLPHVHGCDGAFSARFRKA